ncbi:hypothetical protein H112_08975 [Trichophyton rubrum D6]|uniref:Uncharacterized protein n=2 Tax=Trichophyton rubrum TaxID=5551 RepID=F2SCZ2_TRIRC|nr:uncharacterized protein TERG_01520 [Trichophyton rubrum CBS 118892]EZF09687.1 hypothetical protein H100_08998 [Trichophyton rubrum MR850]EZF36516.1 hypothetical protein H102_08956 [Trichophyton rubrum CBS 100081]EZF47194.1 hypothetical protein H103_08979 [Trichophyton rubrum CBS 288.86]EZF57876.1 hypothetical protein H104_08927 [Trichophyton rubrum CBS 289.86]EZF79166.1 hypothetical protein H110_08979 [Trichophyton rubrum MR1448]EZF89783.1 hypothetical protein H113_09044 [Trichophyton rubr
MSTRPFNPLPACPHPIQWDVPGRITELQTMIDDPTTSEPQKKNLQTAINLYRENELPGHFKWIQDGKVVPHKNIDFKRPYWVEGYGQQLSSQAMVPSQASQPMSESPLNQQLAHRTRYNHYPSGQAPGHEIFARIRPVPGLLSPAFSIDVTLLNDTGSNTMTVFDTDITALGIPPTYMGYGADVLITTAGGTLRRRQISVEIQLLDLQGNAVSDWILEAGIVTPATAGVTRLSGNGIRQSLYFATAPGNQHLYVAEKKNSIIKQPPVI